jgi:hypothetical protein
MKNTLFEVNSPILPEAEGVSQVRADFVGKIVEREKDSEFARWAAAHMLNTERLRELRIYFVALLILILALIKL